MSIVMVILSVCIHDYIPENGAWYIHCLAWILTWIAIDYYALNVHSKIQLLKGE
jgi:hypothetical protein